MDQFLNELIHKSFHRYLFLVLVGDLETESSLDDVVNNLIFNSFIICVSVPEKMLLGQRLNSKSMSTSKAIGEFNFVEGTAHRYEKGKGWSEIIRGGRQVTKSALMLL